MCTAIIRFNDVNPSKLAGRRRLKEFLLGKAATKRPVNTIDYIFCDDDYLLEINRKFLEHDYLTDIITFDLEQGSRMITAEVYISVPRIRENAQIHHASYQLELHRVIFHGLLHLLGFDDKTETQKRRMRKLEDAWLGEYLT